MSAPTAAPLGPLMLTSQGFAGWLAEAGLSLALTTYQAGRLIFLGLKPDGSLRAHERLIEQCQGLWTDGDTLWVSGKAMLWRFANDLPPGMGTAQGADRRFVPREARVTGRIDMHDIGMGTMADMAAPGPIFVNTLYSCLAAVSETASFRPLWRPPFISALVPEDRCHLNGLAMDGDRPAFVTAISRSDVADSWRERRTDGGVVLDVASGEVVASGLSMPHSPRLRDGRLWMLNSGRGELGVVSPADGRFTPVCFCPGYARGLAFIGRWAVVGLSRPRGNQTFEGLPLGRLLAEKDAAPRCGLLVVDTQTGQIAQWMRFEHTIDELYDVAVLPRVRQAEAIGFKGDEIERAVSVE
ncbi:TIGR03032 family protein [Falsiroseomonas tokyonensis]|uniref:TIGR03032 family protein n=1 Tax=Falsiroseomonas tokyonensis TaxID=430521 RepID=A0ABV7C146_9PROT|nr:TIGR03032 family protein [Falsiroseomonas tokyonensis]MBU8540645.1 TIGR03032 family protein [Falsiroseomonas tokyonensis]